MTTIKPKLNEIARVGIFSALAFAGGYMFIAIPNVEIFTAIVFIAGIILGPKHGVLVGIISQSLFSTLNPYGVSPLPLLVVQVLNRALTGYLGGSMGRWVLRESSRKWLLLGIIGLMLTWILDLSSDFSMFLQSGFSIKQMKVTLSMGLLFYLVHGLVNLVIFSLVVPLVADRLLLNQLEFSSGHVEKDDNS
ncbi:MAG: ECF transporter S component [Calditrichaeota bacterium]|nr:MAG: ECF transporter S component [Calditrichota bacterium]